uniref:RING-type domain-containing protein n=1 Tax=Sciurus vulgaris TaxID=55149 RepID=A0A8D2DL03_SCIVU
MPGFDYKFLEKPKRRLLCPLCGKPMREPVQVSTCGHRFCDTCLQEFLRCGLGASRDHRWRRGRELHGEGPRPEARRAFVYAAAQ